MFDQLDSQRLLAIFFAGGLLFNFPLLALWDKDLTVLGVPLFPAALFTLWLLVIAAMAWLMEKPGRADQDD
ncbi:MAG: hypothetical protein RLZZ371_1719 [Pseudomonadota bacterium]